MTTKEKTITVTATINAPVRKVWKFWTTPFHITQWNNASDDWHTPHAENDLREGGKFLSRMEARDGSWGFDFSGVYTDVVEHSRIGYTLDDGRKVNIRFEAKGDQTLVTETFEPESTNTLELQQSGWQAILDNFKKYVENSDKIGKLRFERTIDANVAKVYQTMIDKKHYEDWASVFAPGSHFKGSWEKGAKILFLAPGENGEMGGMVSRIEENIPQKFVSIEHLGIVHHGNEITSGEDVKGWAGALENYSFREEKGKTILSVELDANENYKSYFEKTWPKALDRLQAICEG